MKTLFDRLENDQPIKKNISGLSAFVGHGGVDNIGTHTNPSQISQGKKVFKMFTEHEPKSITKMKINYPNTVIRLADCDMIGYQSTKYDGKKRKYTHNFKKPYPALYTSPEKDILILYGGKFTIKNAGIIN